VARVDVTIVEAYPRTWAHLPIVVWTRNDTAYQWRLQPGDLLFATHNVPATAYHFSIQRPDNEYGRGVTYNSPDVDNGDCKVFRFWRTQGWAQSDGMLYLDADNTAVRFCVVRCVPARPSIT
jgi:hypothetical protein